MNCLPDACYKAGVVYQGTTLSYNSVQVQIQVPSHPVRAGDGYFVLLSIYDNADSYDQIGFGKWGGSNHWGVTYSFTTGPCSTPNFISENNVKDIAEGQTYLFRMTLQLGQLIFSVQWNGATIWSLSFATQASAFIAENIHLCRDGSSWAGYTNYEEVFVIVGDQDVPAWSFNLYGNMIGGTSSLAWGIYFQGPYPPQVRAWNVGPDVVIANHFFKMKMDVIYRRTPQGGLTVVFDPGYVTQLYPPGPPSGPDCVQVSCVVGLVVTAKPNGWGATTTPSSGTPTFSFRLTIFLPSNAPLGVYSIELRADNTPRGQWTLLLVWVEVTVPGGGAGGCIAQGTLLLTPSGYIAIENLAPGSQIKSYDLSTGLMVTTVLNWRNSSSVDVVFIINGNLLSVTPRDQPLYMKNETFTGWIHDPQDLAIGDLLYQPAADIWVVILDLGFVAQTTTVYDVVPSGVGTFIPNANLALVK